MPIKFVPRRGLILICDFDAARIHPEINKRRWAVVISPRSYNRRHGEGPGRCLVVPFSATVPKILTPASVPFPAGSYQSLTRDSWAICDSILAVLHDRLNRVWAGPRQWLDENVSQTDMGRLLIGIKYALGISIEELEN